MKTTLIPKIAACAMLVAASAGAGAAEPAVPTEDPSRPAKASASVDIKKVEAEVEARYAGARPEIKEYVLWTARSFGPGGMWLQEDAFAGLSEEAREKRVRYLAALFAEAEYGRHLCAGLAEAGALKDKRLVPGLMKVAGYHRDDRDYDCRPKWIAVAALARQQSEEAVPLLVSLIDRR